jgi:hypothetical protein
MAKSDPETLTQSAFAKRRNVSRNAVSVWKRKGLLVLNNEGLVDVEKTEWNLDQRPASYRGGVTHRPIRRAEGYTSVAPPDSKPIAPSAPTRVLKASDEPPQDASFDPDDPNLTHAEAIRRKENYLGLLRRRDLEIADREWVRTDEVIRQVEQEYATVRERLLIIPGKLSALLVGLDRADIEAAIRAEVTEALNELHDPAGIVAAAELLGETAEG